MQTQLTMPERLCWSADVSEERLYELLGIVPGITTPDQLPAEGLHRCVIKLDRVFRDRYGDRAFFVLRDLGIMVFSDMKMAEIPSKIQELVAVHLAPRPYMLNIMVDAASTGLMRADKSDHVESLKRFADVCHRAGTLPCAVTRLTTQTDDLVMRMHGGRNRVEQVLEEVALLVECGILNVVCSINEAPAVFAAFPQVSMNCAGVRRLQDATNDQLNRNTPVAALEAGVARLVVGRPLTTGDPQQNYRDFLAEMAMAKLPKR